LRQRAAGFAARIREGLNGDRNGGIRRWIGIRHGGEDAGQHCRGRGRYRRFERRLCVKNAGIAATLYEGSDHIGGRIQTNHGGLASGLYTGMGGEFIDSVHKDKAADRQPFKTGVLFTRIP
jgi:Flavin containing amine oxidoreductase